MRAASAWAHLANDTVTLESQSSVDADGDPTFGSSVQYPARVVGEQKKIVAFAGDEVVSRQSVTIFAPVVVQPTDRITLSTGLVGSTGYTALHPPILGAKRIPDQSGTHHSVVYLGG